MLKIYNSLTGTEGIFKPLTPGKINIYVCGNTVYDYCHIGHARSMIMFDVIVRYLRSQGYDVTYVRNITDIDDKIIKRAVENREQIDVLTRRFIDAQHEDEKALGLAPPDFEPRATEYIPQMLVLIQQLLDRGHAYIASGGDVCFDVRHFKNYGQLSGRDVEKLRAGARVDLSDTKRDPLDFVLWKISKPDEPYWSSPWGDGRPGWHIECSAMSTDLLGQPFDIHGGGMDLKFPHHENEIAQSEAACGKHFAEWWMHIGLLQVDGEKMSKSLGNFITIREALQKYHPEELRFFMMNSSYRRPANYTQSTLDEVKIRLYRFYKSIDGLSEPPAEVIDSSDAYEKFTNYIDDDFNIPRALAHIGDVCGKINILRGTDPEQAAILGRTARKMGKILGILQDLNYLKRGPSDEWEQIEMLKSARDIARTQKNWAEADRIRQQLVAMGLVVEDTPNGTRVSRR